jgi:hypothetical protein
MTPPQKLDISKMLKWYWHHSCFVSVKCHFSTQQRAACLTVSLQCITYSLICTGADTFENIQFPHCRKHYKKRKSETWFESESFECTSEG